MITKDNVLCVHYISYYQVHMCTILIHVNQIVFLCIGLLCKFPINQISYCSVGIRIIIALQHTTTI